MSSRFRKPDQYVQPYFFGDPHQKKTGLWLKNLPKLKPTKMVEPEWHYFKTGKKVSLWMYKSLRLPDKELGRAYRSKTFPGFAKAMAAQWTI